MGDQEKASEKREGERQFLAPKKREASPPDAYGKGKRNTVKKKGGASEQTTFLKKQPRRKGKRKQRQTQSHIQNRQREKVGEGDAKSHANPTGGKSSF